jgi:hypothetical protein
MSANQRFLLSVLASENVLGSESRTKERADPARRKHATHATATAHRRQAKQLPRPFTIVGISVASLRIVEPVAAVENGCARRK